jgi:RNA ligase (TIGR02306 family)
MKKENAASIWWAVALACGLDKKLIDHEGFVVYGEVFGYNGGKKVQDLTYGAKPGETRFAVFDVYNSNPGARGFLSHDDLVAFCEKNGLDRVPVLYDGPYSDELVRPLAYGTSTYGGNIREGFVIRPAQERWNNETRRTILKFVSEDYKLRGNGTEYH